MSVVRFVFDNVCYSAALSVKNDIHNFIIGH